MDGWFVLWPRKGCNRLYYMRKIELHRKGKKSRTVRISPILISSICCWPHLTGKFGTRPFFRWVWVQGRSPQTPGIPKNAYDLVGIPFIRGASGAWWWTPLKRVKALGDDPLRPKEISWYRDTLEQIRAADNMAGPSATRQMERCRRIVICPSGSKISQY